MLDFSNIQASIINIITILPGLLLGFTVHEYAHALVSTKLGDPTPKATGRLTLSPKAHIDPFGFIVMILAGFGWGKPVHTNPAYYRNYRKGCMMVALAGPLSNFLIAIIFSLIMKLYIILINMGILPYNEAAYFIFFYTISTNVLLMVFNLIPVYPLDGFNILFNFCSSKTRKFLEKFIPYGTLILVALIVTNVLDITIKPIINFIIGLLSILITL